MLAFAPAGKERAQGMPGEGLTHGPPANQKAGGRHHRLSRIIRHSLRDGFNGVLRALPGEPGFLAPVAREPRQLTDLTPASGCQDHTTSPSALTMLVSHHPRVHRIPASRSVTIGRTPSQERRDGGTEPHISAKRKLNIFSTRTGQ
jgi:hypothetical protein